MLAYGNPNLRLQNACFNLLRVVDMEKFSIAHE